MNSQYLRFILAERLATAKTKRPKYSKRAFAKTLGLSHGALIEIMNGKRNLSVRRAERLCEALELTPAERDLVLTSPFDLNNPVDDSKILRNDEFELIAQWQHFAIISLLDLPNFKGDAAVIARRLGITLPEAIRALNRLERLGMVREDDSEYWKSTGGGWETTDEIRSESIRQSHRDYLSLAQEKIENISLDKRDFRTITFGVNSKKMGDAKKLIRKFQDEMLELMGDERADEVYIFGTQLIPVTKELR